MAPDILEKLSAVAFFQVRASGLAKHNITAYVADFEKERR